jgi:pimeloyl-ACP methyl ester carboxylesterase
MLFRMLFTQKTLDNEKFMDAAVVFALTYPFAQTLEGFRGQVDAISAFNAADRIRKIKHNTLILSGAEDTLIPPEESGALMDIGGPATFKVIGQTAHSMHAEHPGAFSDAVLEFLPTAY